MKRAVSVSLGSSKRDKSVEISLLGQSVRIERIGTDGNMEKAAHVFKELDGKVDAFGVGGADLGLMVDDKWYSLYSVLPMIRFVKQTPVVDGTGLKNTLENRVAPFMKKHIGSALQTQRALLTSGADRWGMTQSFLDSGFECIFGDLMFGLGISLPLRSIATVKRLASLILPVAGRLPFAWFYPIGERQEKNTPKFGGWYQWATVIAGDCHYIKRFMPARLDDKIICTNTTTPNDVETFRAAGIRYLVTSTPAFEGRSFGVNAMEAALIAVSGKDRKLTYPELSELIDRLSLQPSIQELNK